MESNQNYNQTIRYQIGAGDSVIQILDAANTVLATITETSTGGGDQRLKALQLNINSARLIFKIKNTSGEARIIKTGAFYVSAE